MKDLISGLAMMIGAGIGMFLLIAVISLAVASPLILIAWLLIRALT